MKLLVNPLFWFILLQAGVLGALCYRYWIRWSRAWKSTWLLLVLSLFILGVLSTPAVTRKLERSLSITVNDQGVGAPAYIFVLGGGYLPGASLDQDVLGTESSRRVLAAIAWWRKYPQAKLVFSGAEKEIKIRPNTRLTQLMAETAICHGVPQSHLLFEDSSINTREHPIKALELPGITSKTPIGLVTSAWHMRRSLREFSRYFSAIQIQPVPLSYYSAGWQNFIPAANALEESTIFLQEWVGIFWYAMLENVHITKSTKL